MPGRKSVSKDLDKLELYAHDDPVGHEPPTSNGRKRPTKKGAPNDDEIRMRAYEIYLARNGGAGSPEEDWAQAEEELRGKPLAKPRTSRAKPSSAAASKRRGA
jgi:Protein of unknown function (DUF2934)